MEEGPVLVPDVFEAPVVDATVESVVVVELLLAALVALEESALVVAEPDSIGCEMGSTVPVELLAAAEEVEAAAAVTLTEPPLHFPMFWMLW